MSKNKRLPIYLLTMCRFAKHAGLGALEDIREALRLSTDSIDLAFSIRLAEHPSMWLLIPTDAGDDGDLAKRQLNPKADVLPAHTQAS